MSHRRPAQIVSIMRFSGCSEANVRHLSSIGQDAHISIPRMFLSEMVGECGFSTTHSSGSWPRHEARSQNSSANRYVTIPPKAQEHQTGNLWTLWA